MAEQSFANHTKMVPLFHYFVLPMLVVNFVSSIVRLVHGHHWIEGTIGVLTAAALFLLAAFARIFALTVQDRVIRLEEQLRYQSLLRKK